MATFGVYTVFQRSFSKTPDRIYSVSKSYAVSLDKLSYPCILSNIEGLVLYVNKLAREILGVQGTPKTRISSLMEIRRIVWRNGLCAIVKVWQKRAPALFLENRVILEEDNFKSCLSFQPKWEK